MNHANLNKSSMVFRFKRICLKKCSFSKMIDRNSCQNNFLCAERCSSPDSSPIRNSNFENRPTSSKVTSCVEILKIALGSILPGKFVTFESVDRFSKFDFLNSVESGGEHFSAHGN